MCSPLQSYGQAAVSGNFSVGIDRKEGLFIQQSIYLEDTLLHTTHDLNQGNYTFYSAVGEFSSRFVLRFIPYIGVYAKNEAGTASTIVVQKTPEGIRVQSTVSPIKTVEVYDLLGRLLSSQLGNSTRCLIPLAIPSQVVLVKTELQDGNSSAVKISL